jgi:hypothetical protein
MYHTREKLQLSQCVILAHELLELVFSNFQRLKFEASENVNKHTIVCKFSIRNSLYSNLGKCNKNADKVFLKFVQFIFFAEHTIQDKVFHIIFAY